MEEREIAIQITGLKKRYRLGTIGGGTLRGDLQSWWARVRHKEDPNSKIGSKAHGKNETFMALNGVDLTIYKGERVGIVGHNGAGKSTLLKLLSRVTGPTEGEIKLDGRISSMLEVGTGFNGELTGRENIYLNGAILGMTKAEVDGKIDQIIEFSECAKFIDTPVKRYSSGMYVKLAFAVAAHLDSEILIMDEVLAVGDIAFQQKCLNKMREVAETEGRTILYVSHNMNTVQQLCNRCVVMDHGKVIFDGAVDTAISMYADMSKYVVCYKDYSEEPRKYTKTTNDVYLLSAQYVDKKSATFFANEPMKLRLRWRNVGKVNDVGIRLEIRNSAGATIGSFVCDKFYSGEKGKIIQADFSLNLSNFAPSTYQCTYVFYYRNEFGTCMNVDCVKGLGFEIVAGNDGADSLDWRSQYWGFIKLSAPEIEKIEEVIED